MSNEQKLSQIKYKVKCALLLLYDEDSFLFNNDLCERCLTHRFAVHLEKQDFSGYFIDCEYNKAHLNNNSAGSKIVSNPNGNYIDVIITKRNGDYRDDLVCFEIKKMKYPSGKMKYSGRTKDRTNLEILTDGNKFSYFCGFYIILDKEKSKTVIEIYQNGEKVSEFSIDEL